jgi:hypothetical protein
LRPPFDPQKPTALFIGRYQPFHVGHQRLVTNVFYGRDVGNAVERIVLDEETEAISATKIRSLSAAPGSR